MLEDDIKKVEYYVDFGGAQNRVADSWNRIKKELIGSGQNSAELSQIRDVVLQMEYLVNTLKVFAGLNSLPCGENNKQSESLLCNYESDCSNYGERCASCSRLYRELYLRV